MHLDIFHLLGNLTIHCQEMSKALGANWNLQMQNNETFSNWTWCTWLYSWICSDLSVHGFAHENKYTQKSLAVSVLDTWKVAAHFIRLWYSYSHTTYVLTICHFSLYHISVVINIFWQLLEDFYKDISVCYDSNITTFTRSNMWTV